MPRSRSTAQSRNADSQARPPVRRNGSPKRRTTTTFGGPDNVRRVQEWRKGNPGYWRKSRPDATPLQDNSISKTMEQHSDTEDLTAHALQDLLSAYQPVLLGFLAHFTGFTLQDDIVNFGRRLQQLGQDILTEPSTCRGGRHDNQQTSHPARHGPPGS